MASRFKPPALPNPRQVKRRTTYSLHCSSCFVNQDLYYGVLTTKLVNPKKGTATETLGIP